MRALATEGRLQVTAGASLLDHSRLVEWKRSFSRFEPVPHDIFEYSCRKDVHPIFGRLICWTHFSMGAELFVKGVCMLHGIEFRKPQKVAAYPSNENLNQWAEDYLLGGQQLGSMDVVSFQTLGYLVSAQAGKSILARLCDKAGATKEDRNLVLASFELLRVSIRNRDAHAYVPKVRGDHYFLVPELFCRCLNVLASWLPEGPGTLSVWNSEAEDFVAFL